MKNSDFQAHQIFILLSYCAASSHFSLLNRLPWCSAEFKLYCVYSIPTLKGLTRQKKIEKFSLSAVDEPMLTSDNYRKLLTDQSLFDLLQNHSRYSLNYNHTDPPSPPPHFEFRNKYYFLPFLRCPDFSKILHNGSARPSSSSISAVGCYLYGLEI